MKLALSLLALSSSVLAQTAATTASKPVTHHAASSAAASASALPKVVGLPHTLYSLKYVDIKVGTGELPPPMRFYTVNYTGYLPDGTKFDSSVDPAFKHPTPFTFPYGGHRVITAWDTGFEGMRVGGKRRIFVPYQLGYGMAGSPPKIPAKTNLIFDIELVSFSDKPPAPPARPTPPPPQAPPAGSVPPPTGATTPPASTPAPSAPAAPPATTTPPPASAPVKPATPPTK